ncbi:hypothetical protein BDM02DRAFT_3126224 [Thelephora ganbajun]|uniref:Uncharacterized protein n=1 Tax=Thelephora ganbajun TaxID=370292 RepID=A0ACB6ZSF0_THEGA|nr:hypothetical protein BDM02DRAFT_3126224 [Thelephora ganbajun]
MTTYHRTLRGFTRGQSYYPSLRSSPGVHFLDLLLMTPSYEAEENRKTSVWSLALMLPLVSIYNVWLAVPRWTFPDTPSQYQVRKITQLGQTGRETDLSTHRRWSLGPGGLKGGMIMIRFFIWFLFAPSLPLHHDDTLSLKKAVSFLKNGDNVTGIAEERKIYAPKFASGLLIFLERVCGKV